MTPAPACGTRVVRVVDPEDLDRALGPAAVALRVPAWAAGDPGWSPLALAWVDPCGRWVAGTLAVCRRVPGSTRFLAVLTGAPVLGDAGEDLPAWLPAATALLRREGAFAVRVAGGAPSGHAAPARPARPAPRLSRC